MREPLRGPAKRSRSWSSQDEPFAPKAYSEQKDLLANPGMRLLAVVHHKNGKNAIPADTRCRTADKLQPCCLPMRELPCRPEAWDLADSRTLAAYYAPFLPFSILTGGRALKIYSHSNIQIVIAAKYLCNSNLLAAARMMHLPDAEIITCPTE